jgi:hypothetical protein
MKILARSLFIFFAIVIGLYPVVYLLFDMRNGLLAFKAEALLQDKVWYTFFYQHILFGGIALLAGWSQFSKHIRKRNLMVHRALGKIYLIAVLLSGLAALYIAYFATGGIVSIMGFIGLAIGWLFTSVQAYRFIRRKDIDQHQYWMIRSYALCWAAVTLRIWMPLFQFVLGMEFLTGYRIIAWLCWVPNLIVAEIIVRNLKASRLAALF